MSVKDQQFAAWRRLKELDDESRSKLKEAEAGYQRELEELKKKALRPGGAEKVLGSRVVRAKRKRLAQKWLQTETNWVWDACGTAAASDEGGTTVEQTGIRQTKGTE
jgi:hypothetical protein